MEIRSYLFSPNSINKPVCVSCVAVISVLYLSSAKIEARHSCKLLVCGWGKEKLTLTKLEGGRVEGIVIHFLDQKKTDCNTFDRCGRFS